MQAMYADTAALLRYKMAAADANLPTAEKSGRTAVVARVHAIQMHCQITELVCRCSWMYGPASEPADHRHANVASSARENGYANGHSHHRREPGLWHHSQHLPVLVEGALRICAAPAGSLV